MIGYKDCSFLNKFENNDIYQIVKIQHKYGLLNKYSNESTFLSTNTRLHRM